MLHLNAGRKGGENFNETNENIFIYCQKMIIDL